MLKILRDDEPEANTLHKSLSESQMMQTLPNKIMTQATKKCKLGEKGGTLLWTYLVPVAIVSLLVCCSGFRVITGLGSHAEILMALHPLFCYSLFIGSVIIFLASGISILLYFKKRDKWVDWAICVGIALTLIFVTAASLQIIRGLSFEHLGYSLFMIDANIAFLAFFIKYKAMLSSYGKGGSRENLLSPFKKWNPKIAKVLFSIAVYARCAEIGIACVLLVSSKSMASISLVLDGIISFWVILIIGKSGYKEERAE